MMAMRCVVEAFQPVKASESSETVPWGGVVAISQKEADESLVARAESSCQQQSMGLR